MNPSKKPPDQKEAKVQKEIIKYLEQRGWTVIVMHASANLAGVPDLYAMHPTNGPRWIEVKLPLMKGSRFTKAQKKQFPVYLANNIGIYILTAANKSNYDRLFETQNCGEAMRAKLMGGIPNV